ncbi:MAG: CDP-archaeol synthase [Candidatus Paceibacterota bacterium]|jgi:CDP-2,3-bis-(O-geranylgeranyl)-sn-glycerol synthase
MNSYLYYLWTIFFFFWPAYIANAVPPLLSKINILNHPIDNNKNLWGAPILGNHKTWRGLIAELITCSVFTQIFFTINNYYHLGIYESLGFNSYYQFGGLLFGLILGAGIVFGDISFAFIKRRLKLRPGFPFIPFDQTNYVIGAFIFIEPFVHLGLIFWFNLFILTFFVHILANRLGYNLGLHKAKW